MSNYSKGPWCEKMDALYWNFIESKRDFLLKNYRMSTMVRLYDRFDLNKKTRMRKIALATIQELTD